MYKLFLNDKSINFVESTSDFQLDGINKCVSFLSESQLLIEFQNFETDDSVFNLYIICGKDITPVFNVFCSFFTVIEAAGGLIKNSAHEWLFIFRRGWWDLPKGKIDKRETPKQAAIREVGEETGINGMKILQPLPVTYHIYYLKNKRILKKTYWFEMLYDGNEKLVPQTEEDITEARWLTREEIQNITPLVYPSLTELLLCCFNRL